MVPTRCFCRCDNLQFSCRLQKGEHIRTPQRFISKYCSSAHIITFQNLEIDSSASPHGHVQSLNALNTAVLYWKKKVLFHKFSTTKH